MEELKLPDCISILPIRVTGNPLRFGEPKRLFGAQSHIWGDQPEPTDEEELKTYLKSKEIQNISICLDDIEHLFSILHLTKSASNYTNKLLGKYIILEIQNIVSCFKNLSRVSIEFRQLNDSLNKKYKELDKTYQFKEIRNKLTAHRHEDRNGTINLPMTDQINLWNSITANAIKSYYNVIILHINHLKQLAPQEYLMYLGINNQEIKGVLDVEEVKDYKEFY
jgi:hypothetical protein